MKKCKARIHDSLLTEVMKDTLIEALQVSYNVAKEKMNTRLFTVVELYEIIQQSSMNSMLIGNVCTMLQSKKYINALSRRVTWCQWSITPITVHAKRQMNETK